MSQTIFLKDNVPHIRLKEGEYLVENPGTLPNSVFPCGWSGVELIKQQRVKSIGAWGNMGHFSIPDSDKNEFEFRTVARLLPKEEKKAESAYKEGENKITELESENKALRGEVERLKAEIDRLYKSHSVI